MNFLLADGFKFYKSANNVILCPGNEEGFLPPKYFAKAVDKRTGTSLCSYVYRCYILPNIR